MPVFKLKTLNPGYTLIEFLVVIGILIFAVGSSLLFLTSVLRGSNQSSITAEVKQNGQAVLDSLDSQIRDGKDAISVTPAGAASAVRITLSNGNYLFLACYNANGTTSNGWIGSIVQSSSATPNAGYVALTNTDIIAGVNISNCSFSVQPATTLDPAIVTVSFVANQGVGAPSRQDYSGSAAFRTIISLRKY